MQSKATVTLPDFLGIASLKSGTTWLHALLATHPDVYVPSARKEIHFFDLDQNYSRGVEWYKQFFPSAEDAVRYHTIGEITPHYMFCDDVPARIAQLGTVRKLIAMFRNPIDRIVSHYRWANQIHNYRGSMEQFLEERPMAIRYSLYAENLAPMLEHFSMDQILVLIYDDVFADVEAAKNQVAAFLEIDASRFPEGAGKGVVNKGAIPKFRSAYKMAGRIGRMLRNRGLDAPVNIAKRLGFERLFGKGKAVEPMNEQTRARLAEMFEPDIRKLESMLGRDLSCWREHEATRK